MRALWALVCGAALAAGQSLRGASKYLVGERRRGAPAAQKGLVWAHDGWAAANSTTKGGASHRCPDAARDCVWSGEGIMQPYASTLLEPEAIPQGHDIASVVARCVMEDSGLRPAARAGTLTPELLRPVVIKRMNNGDFGDRYVQLRYKPHIMKTQWSSDVESGMRYAIKALQESASLDIVVASLNYEAYPIVKAIASAAHDRVEHLRAFLYYSDTMNLNVAMADAKAVKTIGRVTHVKVDRLDNMGSAHRAYAWHIHQNYDDLADVTLFVKDAAPVDVYRGQMANVLTYVRKLPARVEAFCGRRVGYDQATYEVSEYKSEKCERFGNCKEEQTYRRAAVRPLGDWLRRYTGSQPGPKVATCLGGVFGAGRQAIQRTPKDTYVEIEGQLTTRQLASTVLEDHFFAERAWLALFGVHDIPPSIKTRVAVYATAPTTRALDLPRGRPRDLTGTWPTAFEVTYLYFCEKGAQVPRGWTRTTVKREDLVHYKYAPHHAEELREYDYTVYVESVPSLTTTTLAGAITTALSTGASVALPTRSVVTDLAADEVLLGYPNAQSKVMQAQQMLDKSKGGVTYSSRFVLRRHTAAAATFNERWMEKTLFLENGKEKWLLGSAFADIAATAAAAELGSTVAPITGENLRQMVSRKAAGHPHAYSQPSDAIWSSLRTWVFVATPSKEWSRTVKRAVSSALAHTSLKPVCVFLGRRCPLSTWLSSKGVTVIHHDPVWRDIVENVVQQPAGRWRAMASPLYASSDSLVATFGRLDIPLLLDPKVYGELVLYTDTDVLWLRDIQRSDFGVYPPKYFTVGAEWQDTLDGDAGVTLLNLRGLRRTYADFIDWTFSPFNQRRGLYYKTGKDAQGAYFAYYEGEYEVISSPKFNWRPYWNFTHQEGGSLLSLAAQPALLHFHGPKPEDYKRYLSGSTYTGGALQSASYWANLDNVAGGHTPFEFEALVATSRRWRPVVVLPVDRTARERAAAEAEAVGRWERFDERPPIVVPADRRAQDARVYVWRQWSKSYFSNCGDHCARWVAYYEKWTVPPSRVPWLLKVGAVVLIALVLMRRRASRRGRPPRPTRVERRASSASPIRSPKTTGRIRRRVSSDQALPNAYD